VILILGDISAHFGAAVAPFPTNACVFAVPPAVGAYILVLEV